MILADISLKRPVFATVSILALVVLGIVSYFSLAIDEWPDVEFPFVTVRTVYQGASPEQVDTKVNQKVEEAVSAVSGVKHIISTAQEGVGFTFIEFDLNTKAITASQEVRDKVAGIRGDLPQGIEEPIIMKFDPSSLPVVSVAVTSDKLNMRELSTLVDNVIKERLQTVNGVASVDIKGQIKREIHVDLTKDKLAAFNLTIPEVVGSLSSENMEVPGGKLTKGLREITLRTMGNLDKAQDFLNVPIGRRDGVQLYVGNIAAVSDTTKEAESMTKFNGKPAIGLDIMKASGANTVNVAEDVKRVVEKIRKDLPSGVRIDIVRDNSIYIKDSVADVLFNLVLGGILAVVIVFVFLGNWRSTIISAITIPASIIATFFVMKMLDFSLNTMSLLALSLAVGLLIDDAIVVIENIVRHMEMGKDKMKAAAEGTEEIGLAVMATTFTLVAVFTPVGMMTGIVGQFFKQFGITVAFAVLMSLVIAFTLTPMLSARFLDVSHGQGKNNKLGQGLDCFNRWFDDVTEIYSRFLGKILSHRWKVLAVTLAVFFGSLWLTQFLGSSFVSRVDNGEFTVSADLDSGKSIDGATAVADKLDEIIRKIPEVEHTYTITQAETVKIFVKLSDKSKRKSSLEQIQAELRTELSAIPGIKVAFTQKSGVGEGKPVELHVKGDNLDTVEEIANQVKGIIESIPGAVDIESSHKPGKPDAQLVVKRDVAADLGVATADIADTIRTLFNGYIVSQFKDGDDRYDVVVRLRAEDRQGFDDLSRIYLSSKYRDEQDRTVMVPLSQITESVYSTTSSLISRSDRQKYIKLTANLDGISLGEFTNKLNTELKQLDLPSGYTVGAMGESERMAETGKSIGIALFLSVAFIFFVLAAQFESYADPFAIMLSLPLAIIGAIIGLLVMKSDMSIMSQIGIIMLMGLVTKNAILLVDFTKQRLAVGRAMHEALVDAARVRMRPIMMTTAAMIFGMLPLAMGIGPGAEGRAPMAHAIIGGLITSTMLTLVVVPVVYSLIGDMKHFKFRLLMPKIKLMGLSRK